MKQVIALASLFILISCSTTSGRKIASVEDAGRSSVSKIQDRFIASIKKDYKLVATDFKELPYDFQHFVTCIKETGPNTYMARFGYESFEDENFKVKQGAHNKLIPEVYVKSNLPITNFEEQRLVNAFEVYNISKTSSLIWKVGRQIATAKYNFKTKCID